MDKLIKNKPVISCCMIFAICLLARCAEYFFIRTDETVIGENFIHKAFGTAVLALILKASHLKWSDIGFKKNSFANFFKGLLMGSVFFAFSFAAEILVLSALGNTPHLELYISGFSVTGSQIKNTGLSFFALCFILNVVNVWMEEGVFRGLFIKIISKRRAFFKANLIAAAFFGAWHIVMPVKCLIDGEMTLTQAALMGIGYIILSGIMSVKWGLLYRMTGSLWAGAGDHLLNNMAATNMLHVVSAGGADELQILRIVLAQAVSFIFVLALYLRRQKAPVSLKPGH